jgi:SanA protein
MRGLVKTPAFRWLLLTGLLVLFVLLPWKWINWRYTSQIYTLQSAPVRWLAIVFGAGLRRDGTPSSVLADRVVAAVKLYQEGKVSKILLSGSADRPFYDEPGAMRELALQLGVRDEDILLDREGSRTFETCQRAVELFKAGRALLISQSFHLPRALIICNALGMDAVGVSADLRPYGPISTRYWQVREIPATFVALWECYIAPAINLCRNPSLSRKIEKGHPYET